MEGLQVFLLVVQIIVAILMITAILLQKSSGDSLSGIGGNSAGLNSVMSSKASANIVGKATMTLATIFMLNCLILALISSKIKRNNDLQIDKIIQEQQNIQESNEPNNPEKKKNDPKLPTIPEVE